MPLPPNVGISDLNAEAVDFLHGLFAPYAATGERDLTVNLRLLGPGFQDVANRWVSCEPCGFFDAVWQMQTEAYKPMPETVRGRWRGPWQFYMGVLPRVGQTKDTAGLRWCAWLWVDLDGGDGTPEEALALLTPHVKAGRVPPPQMMVHSGGGYHAYWRLAELAPVQDREQVERVRSVHQRLRILLGGTETGPHACPWAVDPARILRLPGSLNLKPWFTPEKVSYTQPRVVRLVRNDNDKTARLSLREWEGLLPALKRKVYSGPPRLSGSAQPGELSPATVAKIAQGAQPGHIHGVMKDVATAAVKRGVTDFDAVYALVEEVGRRSGLNVNAASEVYHQEGIAKWAVENITPDV